VTHSPPSPPCLDDTVCWFSDKSRLGETRDEALPSQLKVTHHRQCNPTVLCRCRLGNSPKLPQISHTDYRPAAVLDYIQILSTLSCHHLIRNTSQKRSPLRISFLVDGFPFGPSGCLLLPQIKVLCPAEAEALAAKRVDFNLKVLTPRQPPING